MILYVSYLSLLYSGLVVWVYKKAIKTEVSVKMALDLALIIMIFGFIGARLFHAYYENPEIYLVEKVRIFYVWQGGFVFYGGALAAFFASLVYLKIHNESFETWFNFFTPIFAFGYGLGRVSCFIAGCCYGKFCQLPWAINERHPTQLYAVFWELIVFIILIILDKNKVLRKNLYLYWISFHSVGRLMMEYFRDDFRGDQIFGFSISQVISLVLFTIAAITLLIKSLSDSKNLRKV